MSSTVYDCQASGVAPAPDSVTTVGLRSIDSGTVDAKSPTTISIAAPCHDRFNILPPDRIDTFLGQRNCSDRSHSTYLWDSWAGIAINPDAGSPDLGEFTQRAHYRCLKKTVFCAVQERTRP